MPAARTMRMGVATTALALSAIGVAAIPAAAVERAAHHNDAVSRLSQHGHGAFGECPASATTLLIAVNRLELHPGQKLEVHFIAKNQGTSACTYTGPLNGTATGSAASSLEMGPCGSVGYEVEGAHHRNVWPGRAVFGCPALGFAHLQPGGTASGSGQWDQVLPSGSRVRPGSYALVVDRRFSFRLRVEAN